MCNTHEDLRAPVARRASQTVPTHAASEYLLPSYEHWCSSGSPFFSLSYDWASNQKTINPLNVVKQKQANQLSILALRPG